MEETAVLLNQPALTEAAAQFRKAGRAWQKLAATLLPDNIDPFGETRQLMDKKHALFIEQGAEAAHEISTINGRLEQLRQQMDSSFPLTGTETETFRQQLAEAVMGVHDAEETAVNTLKEAMLN